MKKNCDILVIGSGTAALAFALKAAEKHRVTILTKAGVKDTNSTMAQGGIAAVTSSEDSFESHITDTLVAGAGLCKEPVVRNYIEQAPERIVELQKWGVHFNEDLTREGGHSARRILHFDDQTGAEIHRALLAAALQNPQIEIIERVYAIDLILNKMAQPSDMSPSRALGVYALDQKTGEVHAYLAQHTILATGGAGKVYRYTSNWSGATGDGIAMAYRAGARIANLEFMQFHPTCLFHRDSRNFLISEALRGEGGELVNSEGIKFMNKYHKLGSLAPRDIVARSIDAEMKKTGASCVYLDMTHHSRDYLQQRFPAIYAKCLEYGIEMSTQPIPVVPAAHYLCGGIVTDLHGRTDIAGLWAIGETACTGLHGANRLASNSLLECLTMAHNCSSQLNEEPSHSLAQYQNIPEWHYPVENDADEMIVINHMWDEIRSLMWNYMGIVRSNKRLERAQHRLENILNEVRFYYSKMQIHPDIIELRNIAIVADLSVKCALDRKESRGIHYNLDYPFAGSDPSQTTEAQDTILYRGKN
ncbi:MAG: L-aspartate oxidase [Bdellovibrionia bacterium]